MSSSAITGPVLSDTRRAPSGTAAAPSFAFNDSTGTGVYLVSPGVLGLSTAGVQRVVVDASGNVGIGTASPFTFGTYKSLDIRGAGGGWLNMGTTGTSSFYLFTDGTNSGVVAQTNGYLGFSTNNAERMRIDASGRLCVGRTTGAGTLNVQGDVYLYAQTTGAGTHALRYNTGTGIVTIDASSARYKDNIRDSIYGLDSVLQMRSVQFEYKDTGRSDVGLIAEELNPIVPELVGKNEKGEPDSVSYDRVVSVLVKAIQEQQTQIEKQSQALEALKAEVAALKAP